MDKALGLESIYYDMNWNKLQEKKEKGEAITYIFENRNGKIEYPFIKRVANSLNGVQYYDLVTARGQGGPRILFAKNKEKLIEDFESDFQEYCEKENIIAEYIRFDPWIDNFSDFSNIYKVFSDGNIYCNNLTEDFFNNQYSSSVRNMVRKAEKNGVKVSFDFEGNTIKSFLELYEYTSKKYNISEYYNINKDFIEEYFEKLNDKVFIANAYYDDKIISTAIMLIGKDIIHFHFSATDPEYIKLQPNTYLLYKTELYAQEIGKTLFDFGRATKGSSLEKFKFDFINKKEENIYKYNVGVKIRNQIVYNRFVESRGGKHEGYFPEYR